MRGMMARLKLTVNETKTQHLSRAGRDVRLPGLHVRPVLLAEDGACLPWDATVGEEGAAALRIDQRADRPEDDAGTPSELVVAQLNRKLRGWANYFRLGTVEQSLPAVDRHSRAPAPSVAVWRSTRCRGRGLARYPDQLPVPKPGTGPASRAATSQLPVSDSMKHPCPRAGCGKTATSGSMSGRWKRSLSHRATSRLYSFATHGPDCRRDHDLDILDLLLGRDG